MVILKKISGKICVFPIKRNFGLVKTSEITVEQINKPRRKIEIMKVHNFEVKE